MSKNFIRSFVATWTTILTILTATPSVIHAQSTSEFLQEFSPNAAELGKYGKVPVSYFNGLPDIRIPIYELKARNYTLPVYLSYYAGGNRTEQHPGWVGLGWTLHAGGCINRIVNGWKDEITYDEVRVEGSGAVQLTYQPGYFDHMAEVSATNWMDTSILDGAFDPLTPPDYMPDEFQVNIEDIHASFYFVGNNQIKIVSKTPASFTVQCHLNTDEFEEPEGYPGSLVMYRSEADTSVTFSAHLYRYIDKLVITNKDGTKYHFGGSLPAIEFSINQRYNYQAAQSNPNQYHRWNAVGTANTWMLTKIERPDGEEITFTYERNGIPIVRRLSHRIMTFDEVVGHDQSVMNHYIFWNTFTNVVKGQSVPYSGISYTFLMPSYLKRISCSQSQDFLSITTSDSQEMEYGFSEMEFEHVVGRFEGPLHPFPPLYMKSQSRYRKLKAINTPRCSYSFLYDNLPSERLRLAEIRLYIGSGTRVSSYTMDYNSTPLPAYGARQSDVWGFYNGVSMPMASSDTTGINSRCISTDATLAKAGMLSTLYYPTGGSTSFEYELHHVGKRVNQYPFSLSADNRDVGGLRIKKITDNPSYGSDRIRTFTYLNDDGGSSGILSGAPKCHIDGTLSRIESWYSFFIWHNTVVHDYYHLYEDVSITPLSLTDGNHVTYSSVKETFGDGSYCIYRYSNHDTPGCLDTLSFNTAGTISGRMFGDTFTSRELSRGLLLSKEEYSSAGQMTRKTENQYHVNEGDYIPSVSRIHLSAGRPVYYRMSYDRIFSFFPYLETSTVTTWPESGSGTAVETCRYRYNANRDVSKVSKSRGQLGICIEKTYSSDYQDAVSSAMSQRGMNSYPVETLEIRDGAVVSATLRKYKLSSGQYVPSADYTAALGEGVDTLQFSRFNGTGMDSRYFLERNYTGYDQYGNLTSCTDRGGRLTTWMWGYNGMYPVQITKNANGDRLLSINATYDPVRGLTSITDSRGVTTSYEYDYLGRLTGVKDNDGRYKTMYEYRYKTESVPSSGSNYIRTKVCLSDNADSCAVTTNYKNSLGEPLQTVMTDASPDGGYLYDWITYDSVGRPYVQWLPTHVQGNYGGGIIPVYDLRFYAYDSYSDSRPLVTTSYRDTPNGGVSSEQGPGTAWNTADKKKTYEYQIGHPSMTQTRVTDYAVSFSGDIITIERTGYGSVGEHDIQVTTDEDGHVVRVFKDLTGTTVQIIKDMPSSGVTGYLTTSYVHDRAGRLVAILPPMLINELTGSSSWSSTSVPAIEQYGYFYRYDSRGRMVAKKLPGADWIYYVYDNGDRQILSQDGNQRQRGEWSFILEDKLGRTCLTGICSNSIDPFNNQYASTNVYAARSTGPSSLYGYSIAVIGLVSPEVLTVNWWDDYSFPVSLGSQAAYDSAFRTTSGTDNMYSSSAAGLRTGGLVKTLGEDEENHYLWDMCWYDQEARPVQTVRETGIGDIVREGFAYSFTGNTVKHYIKHSLFGGSDMTESYSYSYDKWGRALRTAYSLNGGSPVTLHDYRYDSVGRLAGDARGDSSDTLTLSYAHNVRSWLTDMTALSSAADTLYTEHITYAPRWNGGIGSMTYKAGGDTDSYTFTYSYDGLGRLVAANDRIYEYDLHGNMTRREVPTQIMTSGQTPAMHTDTGTYSGNRLSSMRDVAPWSSLNGVTYLTNTTYYHYDANGNLTKKRASGQSLQNAPTIEYNVLNLPSKYHTTSGEDTYVYSASGEKLSRTWRVSSGLPINPSIEEHRLDYSSNLVYVDSTLRVILVDGGFFDMEETAPRMHFYVHDHQGNVRVEALSDGTIVKKYNYDPYGERIYESTQGSGGLIPWLTAPLYECTYLWGGKEWDNTLSSYDFGTRYYRMSELPSWTAMDPLCEQYPDISPYAYCAADPVNLVDPDGMEIWIMTMDLKEQVRYHNGGLFYKDGSEYKGSDTFVNQVKQSLDKMLGLGDDYVLHVINTLDASDKTHTFVYNESYDDSTQARGEFGNSLANDGIPVGSWIKLSFKKQIVDEVPNNHTLVVAHELSHSYDFDQGKMKCEQPWEGPGIAPTEIRAVNFENRVRVRTKMPIRTRYTIPIPKRQLADPWSNVIIH